MTIAERYIARIQNAAKKEYARLYWQWITHGCGPGNGPEPPSKLSVMAAQAVRMELTRLCKAEGRRAATEYLATCREYGRNPWA